MTAIATPAVGHALTVIAVPAALTIENAAAFVDSTDLAIKHLTKSKTALSGQQSAVVLEMQQLERFDSAALAVLVALSRRAASHNLRLNCVNVPHNLRKLAALYDIDDLLCVP